MLALLIVCLSLSSFAAETDSDQTDVQALVRLFKKEDSDNDGILTTQQFIDGLLSAFVNLV